MSAFKAKRKSTANGLKLSVVLKLLVVIFPAASAIPLQLLRKLSESNAGLRKCCQIALQEHII